MQLFAIFSLNLIYLHCQFNEIPSCPVFQIWAATWQNQQHEGAPREDSDQPGHPPSLIRVFAVPSMGSEGHKVSSCGQRKLWSGWANAQADLSLRWAHTHFFFFFHVEAHFSFYWCLQYISSEPSMPLTGGKKIPYHSMVGNVEFSGVTFNYPTRHEHVGISSLIWATSRKKMSSRIIDHIRFKLACSATEARWNLETLDIASIHSKYTYHTI